MKIVNAELMREIEARSERAGVSTDELMERAGLEVARRVRHHVGHLIGVPILVLVGPGNNGGDGLVTARHLHNWGARVTVYLCMDRRSPDPKLDDVQKRGLPIVRASDDGRLARLEELLSRAHAVVDAVLGTGRSRPIEGVPRQILSSLGLEMGWRRDMIVLALDLPTGLDSDSGAVDPVCPGADVTVALGYPKTGLFLHPGADAAGTVEVVDIGVPPGLDEDMPLDLMTDGWASDTLPYRSSGSHKGTYGKTLVVAGSRNYVGAAYLAATAATRVGAGLVTIAIPESLQAAIASSAIEPTYLPLPESSPGVVASGAASVVLEAAAEYDTMLIGCGLGLAPTTVEMVEEVLLSGAKLPPLVVDADGLNVLARSGDEWWSRLPKPAVLTPHAGEMARLVGKTAEEVQAYRIEAAIGSALQWGQVTVLKGAHTIVADPEGTAMISPFTNPGLATAGTGDVLAGAIAGLLSQGLRPIDTTAALGVYLHGAAGERVRDRLGEAGMVASDLLPELPRAIDALRTPVLRR